MLKRQKLLIRLTRQCRRQNLKQNHPKKASTHSTGERGIVPFCRCLFDISKVKKMSITRVSHKQVEFSGPFKLKGHDETFPRGDYDVETEEELIEGVSFLAYRRTATLLHVLGKAGARALPIDPRELDRAILMDRGQCDVIAPVALPKRDAKPDDAISRAEGEGMPV
tara:strand:- start:2831 stop:3331 length:501 start_codon:yes stop_codon:yes gene_type:complete